MFCISIKWSNGGNLDNLSSVSLIELYVGIGYINEFQEENKEIVSPPSFPSCLPTPIYNVVLRPKFFISYCRR